MAQSKVPLTKTIKKLNEARQFLAFMHSQLEHCNNEIVDYLNNVFNPVFREFNKNFDNFEVNFYAEIKENRLGLIKPDNKKRRVDSHYVNIDIFCVPVCFDIEEDKLDTSELVPVLVQDLLRKLKSLKRKLQMPMYVNFGEAPYQDYLE